MLPKLKKHLVSASRGAAVGSFISSPDGFMTRKYAPCGEWDLLLRRDSDEEIPIINISHSTGQGADDNRDLYHQMVSAVLHWPSKKPSSSRFLSNPMFKPGVPRGCLSLLYMQSTRERIYFLIRLTLPLLVLHNRPRSPSPCVSGTSTSWMERRR